MFNPKKEQLQDVIQSLHTDIDKLNSMRNVQNKDVIDEIVGDLLEQIKVISNTYQSMD